MIFLSFIQEVAQIIDGGYIYEFFFTDIPETVWGEYFNVSPATVIPNLTVESESVKEIWRVESPYHFILAKDSSCFSMQDAFDNIIPLGFVDIEQHDLIMDNNKVLKFEFGESEESVVEKFEKFNLIVKEKTSFNWQDTPKNEKFETNENDEDILSLDNRKSFLFIKIGHKYLFENLKDLLFSKHYNKVELVSKCGEYAIRGNIIDIFSYDEIFPYRIVFDDNIVEKIYMFNEDDNNIITEESNIEIRSK